MTPKEKRFLISFTKLINAKKPTKKLIQDHQKKYKHLLIERHKFTTLNQFLLNNIK